MGYPKLFFESGLTATNVVASNTFSPGNYAAGNVTDFRAYSWWKAASLPSSLTADFLLPRSLDYALIAGHDLHSQGCSLEVRGSTDGFVASDVLIDLIAPTSDDPFLLEFNPVSYRHGRLAITGLAGATPSIAIALLGSAFVMPALLQPGFNPLSRKLQGQSSINDNGHPLGVIYDFEQFKQTIKFDNVTWDWLRDTWDPVWKSHLRGTPSVFAWDSVNFPNELNLVTTSNPDSPHKSGGLSGFQIELSGVAK